MLNDFLMLEKIDLLDLGLSLLHQLTTGTFETCYPLFQKEAQVIGPGGVFSVENFLKNFYEENTKVEVTVFNQFYSFNQQSCAFYLELTEHKIHGLIVKFQTMAIVEQEQGKIKKLTILFDTYPIRTQFPELF